MSNVGANASSIIDRAITLKEGGVIVIPCSSQEEMERLRVRLYKVRNQLRKRHKGLAISLDITRRVKEEEKKWTLYVSKERPLSGVLVVEDGEATPFTLEAEEETKERRNKLMAEDKLEAKDELELEFEDFDSVAEKLEKAQGMPDEED